MLIAGHAFPDADWRAVCGCGRRLTDILNASREDVGKLGIAHIGMLTDGEFAQIEAYRDRIWAAVSEVAG